MKQKEPAYVAATLRWCNARRKERGKKPLKRLPRGTRYDGRSCPCGRATGLNVDMGKWFLPKDNIHLVPGNPIPRGVKLFVDDFDGGKLPQYEAKQ